MDPAPRLRAESSGIYSSSVRLPPAATPSNSRQTKGLASARPSQPVSSDIPKQSQPARPSNQSKRPKTGPAPSIPVAPQTIPATPPYSAWTMPPVPQFPPPFTPGPPYHWGSYAGAPYYPQPPYVNPYVAPGGPYAVPPHPFPPSLPTPPTGAALQPQFRAKTVSIPALQPQLQAVSPPGVPVSARPELAPKPKRARFRAPEAGGNQPAPEAHSLPQPQPEVTASTTGVKSNSQPGIPPLPPMHPAPAVNTVPPPHPTAGEASVKPEPHTEGGQWTWTVSPFHPGQLVPIWQPLQPPKEESETKREKRDREPGLPAWPPRPFEYIPRGKYLESMPLEFQEKVKAWKEEKAKVAALRAKIEQHSRRAHRNELGKKRRHKKTEELNAAAVARGEIAPYHPPGLGKRGAKRKPLLSLKQQQEMRERLEKREREERLKRKRGRPRVRPVEENS